jgi:hypothetical protein
MHQVIIISRDPGLRQRIPDPRLVWIDSPDAFESALGEGVGLALVDVCLDCGRDVADIVRECRDRGRARRVVAFLSGCGGDAAIRAHLAGADRIIPVDQVEDELAGLADF